MGPLVDVLRNSPLVNNRNGKNRCHSHAIHTNRRTVVSQVCEGSHWFSIVDSTSNTIGTGEVGNSSISHFDMLFLPSPDFKIRTFTNEFFPYYFYEHK